MSLEFKDVSYIYDADSNIPVNALKDINLEIKEGVFYALIGHTGSGKSTLVQHMNGLMSPTRGEVLYNGVPVRDKDMNLRELRSKVGLVFQYPEHQLFEVSVYDDVCFGPKNMKLPPEEIKKRADDALRLTGVDESLWKLSPFELSGGQKRRVAIAGVLAMQPEILILDEPTAGLDPGGRDEILKQIKLLHESRRITIVLVSHSMEDVARFVDRIIVMNKGCIEYNDTPANVFRHVEELEEMGLSAPKVTYVMRKLRSLGLPVKDDVITVSEAADEIEQALRP